ncbi:MAG: DUF3089 domain-containing protein [Actinomycetota bacterium]
MNKHHLAGVILACLITASCGGDGSSTSFEPTDTTAQAATQSIVEPYVSKVYSDPANWTCRPDTSDTCDDDTSVTLVNADGSTEVLEFAPDPDASVDCFYLYPTSSEDVSLNSDYSAGNERVTAYGQVARFSSVCRLFAPTYRSVTLAGLFDPSLPGDRAQAWNLPFDDVQDAWKHYLANDNKGRGVILLSHSQGTGQMARLIDEVIDGDDAQRSLIVSAALLGGSIAVPRSGDVGGRFDNLPMCRSAEQTGCIMTFATFRDTKPPSPDAFFGKAAGMGQAPDPTEEAGCTNPAALSGGSGDLLSAFSTSDWGYADGSGQQKIATPFMGFPGLISAECVSEGDFSYLRVTIQPDPTDPRADDIRGDLDDRWGLHAVDWEIAALSILDVVRQQIDVWVAAN